MVMASFGILGIINLSLSSRVMSGYLRVNKIARLRKTGGTEPSKYPQEKKIIMIP